MIKECNFKQWIKEKENIYCSKGVFAASFRPKKVKRPKSKKKTKLKTRKKK